MPDALITTLPTMTGRSVRLSLRSPDALLTALLLPVMPMVVFVYLFGGAVAIGISYIQYVVPGVLLLCAATGASTTAVTVCQDMADGIIDRWFRSLDVPGTVVLAGPAGRRARRPAAVRRGGLVAGRGVRAGGLRPGGG
jgi:ABC-2 type transport system permease protein